MKRSIPTGRIATFALLALSLSPWAPAEIWAQQPSGPLVVFLVRHAEKVDTSADPELSAEGKKRAKQLADVLRDAELQFIHSSDYIRTRDTAAPIAARTKREVEQYDAKDLPKLVAKIREQGGRHLVVGHSSTTPKVAELLGGKPGTSIDEPSEYDRLYIVTVDKTGAVSTVLMRYGKSR